MPTHSNPGDERDDAFVSIKGDDFKFNTSSPTANFRLGRNNKNKMDLVDFQN